MKNPQVDPYFIIGCGRCPLGGTPECKVNFWRDELLLLRTILLDCGLVEELKWSMPCYTYKGTNVLILAAFNDFCSINFFKGVLLQDEQNVLELAGENSQSAKLFKFTSVSQVREMEAVLKAYVFEAIEVEKAGLKVAFKKPSELELPAELEQYFAEFPAVKVAFEALTPGRQRGYAIHFSQPKQSKTRTSRIEKCVPKILEGKGMHD